MRKAALFSAAVFLALAGVLIGQTKTVPSFRFLRENSNGLKDPAVLRELKRCTVRPTREQETEILKSMLRQEINPSFFEAVAKHCADAFDKDMRAEYNRRIKASLDDDDVKAYTVDESGGKDDFISNDTNEDPASSTYAFRCLDFDGDKKIDLVIFNQVYFGPSPGLVFYGRSGDGFVYLFDCSGAIAKIERLGDRLYFRFVVSIIDPSETEILASIAYDFKTKTSVLDSKLYYAQQTRFPRMMAAPEPFELQEKATLRFSPAIDDTPNRKDANGYEVFAATRTLYGNAVAEYPKSAGGYIIARDKGWAFVAFDARIRPVANSLYHGMEPGRYDKKTETWTPIHPPCEYYCGWIEVKDLAAKK